MSKIKNKIYYLLRLVYSELLLIIYYQYLLFKAYTNFSQLISPQGFSIVTLTSYPARFSSLFISLDQLSRGKVKPVRIILFLSREENLAFAGSYPYKIKALIRRGLEIILLEENYRVFNKLPVFLKQDIFAAINLITPFDINPVITIDDDKIPPLFMLEFFQYAFAKEKNITMSFVVQDMIFSQTIEGVVVSLIKSKNSQTKLLGLTNGIGGTLYPMIALHSIRKHGLDFLKHSPTNDDIWFRFCNISDGISCRQLLEESIRFRQVPFSHHLGIWKFNFSRDEDGIVINDKYLISCYKHFGISKMYGD